MFRRLLYISTMRAPLAATDVGEILRVSRANNARDDITGLLIVGNNRFLQLLEGPAAAVDRTYDRIKQDPRHFAAVTLDDREGDTRLFPEWAMGEAMLADGVPKTLLDRIEDPTLRAQFESFSDMQARAA